jgi:hypothetical protein
MEACSEAGNAAYWSHRNFCTVPELGTCMVTWCFVASL